MFDIRPFALPLLLLLPSLSAADAPLLLQTAQVKALGIETAAAGGAGGVRPGTLAGSVVVPNEQLRIVSAPVAGMVEMLAAAPGDSVRRGQVLARLASPQALELHRDTLQADAQARLLQQNLQRDEQLFAEGLIAESRLQATRATAAQAAAQARERRQSLALAGLSPGKPGDSLAVLAPIDGVVLEQGAQLGKRVEASALLYRIARLSPLWLEVQAPVALAASLREGGAVRVRTDAPATAGGRIVAIGRAVEPASQTVLVRAQVDAGAAALRPGQVVEVELDATATPAGQPTVLRIPAAAIVRHESRTLVFIQAASDEAGTRFAPRPVRIVSQSGDGVLVEGLATGDPVAVKGVSGLKAILSGVGKE